MTWWQYVLNGIGGLIGAFLACCLVALAQETIKQWLQGRKGHNDK